jgi:hypothetical protein
MQVSPLERRAEAFRSRIRVRAWEFRQLAGSKGTWFRLRRLLAGARDAYAVDAAAIEELLAEGHAREPVGDELEPPRSYVVVSADRASRIATKRPLRVRLSAELLGSPNVVLVPFDLDAKTSQEA